MLGQFIDATGSQKFKKLDPITYTDRAVLFQSFQISTKMRSYIVTSALSVIYNIKHKRENHYYSKLLPGERNDQGKRGLKLKL